MFVHPAPGFITGDRFGERESTTANGFKTAPMHGGQDFYPAPGKSRTIVAAANGVVVKHPYNSSAGNAVAIYHPALNRWTGYAHNATVLVAIGTKVAAGQPIAVAGSTGASTGVHLHFDVFTSLAGFVRVDPLPLIGSKSSNTVADERLPLPKENEDMFLTRLTNTKDKDRIDLWTSHGPSHVDPASLPTVQRMLGHVGAPTAALPINSLQHMQLSSVIRSAGKAA